MYELIDLGDSFSKILNVVIYYMIGNEIFILVLFVITYFYVKSVKDRDFEAEYRRIQSDGVKILIQEKYDFQGNLQSNQRGNPNNLPNNN